MNDRCADHLAMLLRLVERGDEIPRELKSHLATCAECARLLEAMNRVHTDLEGQESETLEETVVVETVEKSAAAVSRSSRLRNLARAAAVTAVMVVASLIIGYGAGPPAEELVLAGAIFASLAGLLLLLAAVYTVRKSLHAPGVAIYKRLKPGRQLDGVCLGLSEATAVPLVVLRVLFIALFFVNGAGFWLYILFSLLMPVHPDDRQYLLRFRIARAVGRMTSRGRSRKLDESTIA